MSGYAFHDPDLYCARAPGGGFRHFRNQQGSHDPRRRRYGHCGSSRRSDRRRMAHHCLCRRVSPPCSRPKLAAARLCSPAGDGPPKSPQPRRASARAAGAQSHASGEYPARGSRLCRDGERRAAPGTSPNAARSLHAALGTVPQRGQGGNARRGSVPCGESAGARSGCPTLARACVARRQGADWRSLAVTGERAAFHVGFFAESGKAERPGR